MVSSNEEKFSLPCFDEDRSDNVGVFSHKSVAEEETLNVIGSEHRPSPLSRSMEESEAPL